MVFLFQRLFSSRPVLVRREFRRRRRYIMMKFIKQLIGYTIKASDGDIGAVEEFYFDEDAWRVAYALVNLSDISERRHVLISLDTFMEPDWKRKRFLINATRELVRQSPD